MPHLDSGTSRQAGVSAPQFSASFRRSRAGSIGSMIGDSKSEVLSMTRLISVQTDRSLSIIPNVLSLVGRNARSFRELTALLTIGGRLGGQHEGLTCGAGQGERLGKGIRHAVGLVVELLELVGSPVADLRDQFTVVVV